MKIFVTGGTGVMGRLLVPRLKEKGHEVVAPGSRELDLFDAAAVHSAVEGSDVVYHLATRILPRPRTEEPGVWTENDRLRSIATSVLVDAALDAKATTFVLPSIAFLYPPEGPVDEASPFEATTGRLNSMVDAEEAVRRFAASGERGVSLRFGLFWGPGTGNEQAVELFGTSLHIEDAVEALILALDIPSGHYNVVQDGQRVSTSKFKAATGWTPRF